jgi:hypothetical protein
LLGLRIQILSLKNLLDGLPPPENLAFFIGSPKDIDGGATGEPYQREQQKRGQDFKMELEN